MASLIETLTDRIDFCLRLLLLANAILILPLLIVKPDVMELGVQITDQICTLQHMSKSILNEVPKETKDRILEYDRGIHSEYSPLYLDERRVLVSKMNVYYFLTFQKYLSLREWQNFADMERDADLPPVEPAKLDAALQTIGTLFYQTGGNHDMTFGELASAVDRTQVDLPIINQKVSLSKGVIATGIGVVLIMLYLTSFLNVLHKRLRIEQESHVIGTILFHPNWFSLVLSLFWLLLPIGIVGLAISRSVISIGWGKLLLLVMAIASAPPVVYMFICRRLSRKLLLKLGGNVIPS